MSNDRLGSRSIRTLAWLGDAEYERELRWRIARRGDWPTRRLDRARAKLASAGEQARLLALIEDHLDDGERSTVSRARNASVRNTGRGVQNVRDYRSATALEALVAYWSIERDARWARFEQLLGDALEEAIDLALDESGRSPRPDR